MLFFVTDTRSLITGSPNSSMALPKLNINGITMKKICKLAIPPN